jgi:hypothetical protein
MPLILSIVYASELRDIRPPVEYPPGGNWWWWAALAALLVLYKTAGAWRGRFRSGKPAAVVVPPRERALRILSGLGRPDKRDEADGFYQEISNLIREYLREVGKIPAADMTTAELEDRLRNDGPLSGEDARIVLSVLRRGDDVKFARATVTDEVMTGDIKQLTEWLAREVSQP